MHELILITVEPTELEETMLTVFSSAVDAAVENIMEPYSVTTENPNYLESIDKADDLKRCYESDKVDCMKLPEGRIVPYESLYDRFLIRDGKVYEYSVGPLKHEKRTKRAKRLKSLPEYPIKKLFPVFQDYAENYYHYSEENGKYGFYLNLDAFWDWYSLGGRWPELFLVKENCKESLAGERGWTSDDSVSVAPEGYKWACAARKKDIEGRL